MTFTRSYTPREWGIGINVFFPRRNDHPDVLTEEWGFDVFVGPYTFGFWWVKTIRKHGSQTGSAGGDDG